MERGHDGLSFAEIRKKVTEQFFEKLAKYAKLGHFWPISVSLTYLEQFNQNGISCARRYCPKATFCQIWKKLLNGFQDIAVHGRRRRRRRRRRCPIPIGYGLSAGNLKKLSDSFWEIGQSL